MKLPIACIGVRDLVFGMFNEIIAVVAEKVELEFLGKSTGLAGAFSPNDHCLSRIFVWPSRFAGLAHF